MTKTASTSPNLLARLGTSARRWASTFITPARQINEADTYLYGAGSTTVASLLGSGKRLARTRQSIYDKWAGMEADPIIATAVNLLVTAALGGHETSGALVFIEKTPAAQKNKRLAKIVDEISADIAPLLNRIVYQVAYTGAVFGDAYARVYADARGVVDLYADELVRPPLVQPFERGSRTVGYAVYTGERNFERLNVAQMARLKMPRTQWVPQHGVVEKSLRMALAEDDVDRLPLMPSMVGGSLLYNAEDPYDNLTASLLGLVGQRWMDSIDEQMVAVNMASMTKEQQDRFLGSVANMLKSSKLRAEEAVKNGRPVMERIRHLIPVFGEKQLTTIGSGNTPGRASSINIEDVLLHARLLAGALGTDLSMIGFADQLSGGLGEGGFFRVSAQAAERARIIRVALAEFCDQIVDIHTLRRYGMVFDAHDRPWNTNFYGSISALEAEKQRTRLDSMNAGMLLVQSMQMMKDMGASRDIMNTFLTKTMLLDEDQATQFAAIVETAETSPENLPPESEGEPPTLDSVPRYDWDWLTAVPIPQRTLERFELSQSGSALDADLTALAAAHEAMPDTVLSGLQFVLASPQGWFVQSDGYACLFKESIPSRRFSVCALTLEQGRLRCVSYYSLDKRQLNQCLKHQRHVLRRLGLPSGEASLSRYLRMQHVPL